MDMKTKGGCLMNTVINKLSEIEETAGSILDEATTRKKAFAAEMEAKTAAFDAALEQETAERIARIQKKMEEDMNRMLAKQSSDAAAFVKRLEENYDRCHKAYADKLFRSMIKE